MKAPYLVIIPTEDPNVGCAYQCATEAGANDLAVSLVREHGKCAVIAVPISVTHTAVTVHKMVSGPTATARPRSTVAMRNPMPD